MGHRIYGPWTEREDNIVRKYGPKTAVRRLAGRRTHAAVIQRRYELNHSKEEPLKHGRGCWSVEDNEILRRYYPTVIRAREMKRYLPGFTTKQIIGHARLLGLRRKHTGDPRLKGQFELVDQVRIRAKEDGITFQRLDRELKTGWYFQNGFYKTKSVNLRNIAKAIAYFGGTLVIDWHDH
jgi:hypothetical protein